MKNSYGVLGKAGTAISGTNDWTSQAGGTDVTLTFDRDVTNAVVIATHHRPVCDSGGPSLSPIKVGKRQGKPNVVCVFNAAEGFSFHLIDAELRSDLGD